MPGPVDSTNLEQIKRNLQDLTADLKKAEDSLGKFFALGSTSREQVGGMTPALDDLAKSVSGVMAPLTSAANLFDNMFSSLTEEGNVLSGFTGMITDATAALAALPDGAKQVIEIMAGAFDGPTREMRKFDKEIFSVGKRFGDPIQASKDFADAIQSIPASDFGSALSLTRDELSRFYQAAATTNLTQEQLNETVNTGVGATNLLAAAYAFGESAGMNSSATMRILNDIINKQGVAAGEAADMLGIYAGVAKDVGLQIDDVANTLNRAVSGFSKLGISADFGAPVLEGFGRVVRDMGLGIEEAGSLTRDLSSALGGLTTNYANAYVMFQRGGLDFGAGGGALGASIGLQAELLRAEQTGDQAAIGAQLVGAMRDTISSFAGGDIVTVSQAAESPELQTQFFAQQQLLMNQFGIRDQASATRTLELLAEIDDATRSGNMEAKEELQKQLENEIEGRDKTLDVLEQINREIAAQSNLLAIVARKPLEALQEAGMDIAQVYASPAIEGAGEAARDIVQERSGDIERMLRTLSDKVTGEGGVEAGVPEIINDGRISESAQDATNVELTNKELRIVTQSVSSAIRDGLNEETLKAAFRNALVEAFAESGRDVNTVNVVIDFNDPEMASLIRAAASGAREMEEG